MNPMQMIKMMMSGNPQDVLLNELSRSNIPALNNVANMLKNGDAKGIEEVARNLGREKGIDVDAMYNQLMSQIKH